MKIAVVALSGIYPVQIGGPASVSYFLAKWLGKSGNDVTLFTRFETQQKADLIERIDEFKVLQNVNIVRTVMHYSPRTFVNIPHVVRSIFRTTRIFAQNHFDLVFYNSQPIDIALLFPLIAKLKGAKQVLAIHGALFMSNRYFLGRLLVSIQKRWFDAVATFSRFSKNLAIRAGFEEDKIMIVPNGIELELVEKSGLIDLKGQPKILFVGRLSEHKDVHILLEGFASTAKKFPGAILYIVGDGPLRGFLERFAEQLGIRDKVVFKGFVPTTSVYSYYKSVDALVIPSQKENFSITLLEGMAAKVPIVASDAEGNVEVIFDGRNGLVFPRGNPNILSEKLELVLSDLSLARRLADTAFVDTRTKYSWKSIASIYCRLFHSLLS